MVVAAERLFAQRGYDGVSMQQIASAAAISKANIYHHFQSKDALYLAVLKHALHDINELLTTLQKIDGNAHEQLRDFSAAHLHHINSNSSISRLILREMLDSSSARGQELAEQVFAEYFSLLKKLIYRCQQRGEVRSDIDPDHMAAAVAGINVFLFQSWSALQHFPGDIFNDQQKSGETMFDLLFNGFAPRGDNR
ncbi:MAG: TetR/AcrR family transcriptional regulator [Mariprofundales bacterium]|nr:TetR/AcrR family transcriptional regulator [Mariprofundales bacterium]